MTAPGAIAPAESLENPLIEGLERLPVHPTALVIFGATGDLAHRKLLPALYNLAHEGALPERFELIGVARSELSHEEFAQSARESIERFSRTRPDADVLDGLVADMRYVPGSFDQPRVYSDLDKTLTEFSERAGHELNRVFYLSTAPQFFPVIAGALGDAGLNRREDAEVRIVIEKPFGYDLASAQQLNAQVLDVFEESQVFRIDHYLGKETVQNLLALRFANALFEPVWNRNYIDNVQITAAEDIGIEGRAGYYEGAGALRDLVQNHMMQLLALLTMEPPAAFEANRLRDEKLKVLEAIVPPHPRDVHAMALRAQYGPGNVAGQPVPGYRQEEGVDPNSRTETYAALRLEVSNWRWAGVPFYLRTGKRLSRKLTEIAVTLKPVPHLAFQSQGSVGVQPNQIVLTVQPDEGVSVSLGAKIPGPRMRIRPVYMEFRYGTSFMSESPEAYERLILDAMRGDATLFTRNDEIEALWGIIDPILTAWHEDRHTPIRDYPSGSAGPTAANALLDHGHEWRRLMTEDLWSDRRHDARRDRRCTAGPAAGATRRQQGAGARAGAEPGRDRRPRLEGRDRKPAAARRPLPRLAHGAVRGRGRARDARRPGGHELRGAGRRSRARGDARGGRDRHGPGAPRASGDDHRPGDRRRAADDAVVAARPRRGGAGVALAGRRDPARFRGPARTSRRRSLMPRISSGLPTWSTSRGCGPRPGASDSRRRSIRLTGEQRCARSRE